MATATSGVGYVLSQVELPNDGVVEVDAQTSYLCDATVPPGTRCSASNAIAAFHGDEDRENVTLDRVPAIMQQALLSAEDRDYFEHRGVDPSGIARAAWSDIRSSGGRQGGSTITQQYVKNVFLTDEQTLNRKVKEAVMAIKLEQKVSKRDILERYLNVVYFGRGAYGIQAAAQAYYGKDVEQLGLPESAFLAGLIRSPESGEPFDSGEENTEARRRRKTVLVAMEEEGYIDSQAVNVVDAVPLDMFNGLLPPRPSTRVDYLRGHDIGTEYFVEYVRRQLVEKYGETVLYGGGLRIHTTLDPTHQRAAWNAVTSTLDQPGDPAGALVAVDDQGHIKAMMGGREFGLNVDKGQSAVNLATGKAGGGSGREPGSTFKPFALAEAIRQGYSIDSRIKSPNQISIDMPNETKDWEVDGGCCGGRTNLIEATKRSVNTAYAQLMVELGPEKVVQTARELGVTADLQPNPSLVLGSGAVSVLDMASAYSTFQRGGVRVDPVSIVQVEVPGAGPEQVEQKRQQVLTPDQNAKVVYCLEAVVGPGGTGRAAGFGRPIAGKTGTSQKNTNAWFVGFTPKLTAAVWMGHAGTADVAPAPMDNVHGMTVQGGNFPAQIWRKYMETVADTDVGDFPSPPKDLLDGRELFPNLVTVPPTTTRPTTSTTTGGPSSTTTQKPPPTTVTPPTTKPGKPPKPPKPPPTTQPETPTTLPAVPDDGDG